MMLVAVVALTLSAADAGAAAAADTSSPLELGEEVRMLYDLVTCQQTPDAGPIADYCKKQLPRFQRFREHWGKSGEEFLTSIEPKDLPPELVYPFGGGDLMMALTAFPDAKVITTMSLELAGDPRRIKNLKDPAALDRSLKAISEASASTLVSNDSKSINLSKIQQGELPGQLSMHLMGLALHDQVPVAARFFQIKDDGSLHYYSKDEIDALEGQAAKKLSTKWKTPDFSPAFANVEVQFVPKDNPKAPPRTFRHIGADLSNDGLKAAPGVIKHLESKGTVTVMTKAASYLLWNEAFSDIRKYLVTHARFMLSDSTGALPRFWPKGCVLKTYGAFTQTFLGTWKVYQEELAKEFATQPQRALPFRFGYPDGSPEKKSHLMTMECPKP
jgi:hypothetical protein